MIRHPNVYHRRLRAITPLLPVLLLMRALPIKVQETAELIPCKCRIPFRACRLTCAVRVTVTLIVAEVTTIETHALKHELKCPTRDREQTEL